VCQPPHPSHLSLSLDIQTRSANPYPHDLGRVWVGLRVGYGYPHFYPFPPLRPSSTGHGYSQKSEASQETQAGMEVRHEGRGAGMATSGCAMAAGVAPAGAGGTDEACCRVWRKSLLFYAMKRVLQYLCGGGAKSIAHVAACSGATSVVEAKTSVESYLWRCCMVYGERRRPWRRCTPRRRWARTCFGRCHDGDVAGHGHCCRARPDVWQAIHAQGLVVLVCKSPCSFHWHRSSRETTAMRDAHHSRS
jgi:hypothetical protein